MPGVGIFYCTERLSDPHLIAQRKNFKMGKGCFKKIFTFFPGRSGCGFARFLFIPDRIDYFKVF